MSLSSPAPVYKGPSFPIFEKASLPESGVFISHTNTLYPYTISKGIHPSHVPNPKYLGPESYHGLSLTPDASIGASPEALTLQLVESCKGNKSAIAGYYRSGSGDTFADIRGYYINVLARFENRPEQWVILFAGATGQLYQVYAINLKPSTDVPFIFGDLKNMKDGMAFISYPEPGYTYRHNEG